MKFLKLLIFCLCLNSCAPIYVAYDYETKTSFSEYKTFGFFSNMETGLSELDEKRFVTAIESKLIAQGLSKSITPDFYIDIKSDEFLEQPQNNVGVGLGSGGIGIGGGISIGMPIGTSNINRQITVEFVDETKSGLFWQAKSDSAFDDNASPAKRELRLTKIVEKIFSKYPPDVK